MASNVSVSVPIWFTLIRMEFAIPFSIPSASLCGICYKQIVSNQLDLAAQSFSKHLPAVPVVLCKTVFYGNNRILVTEHFIVRDHFLCSSAYAFACQVVNILFCIIEFT